MAGAFYKKKKMNIVEKIDKYLNEKMKKEGDIFKPKKIDFDKFSKLMQRGKFEGLVFLGAGVI